MILSLILLILLWGSSIGLVLWVGQNAANMERRDYRVVHFALRLALTFGIGAVVVGVILVSSQLKLIPTF
jgi:hypothetical protein